jgi:cytochrome P450 family 33
MQLKNTIFDLWIAGMETTSNTLTWAILYLLHNPDCQRRIHEEFDREIGSSDRLINMNDKIRLNYCNAVINVRTGRLETNR